MTTKSECETAAKALGVSDITAVDDGQNGATHDPPFCYFEENSLKFNGVGTNTGACTTSDQCLCSTICTGNPGLCCLLS